MELRNINFLNQPLEQPPEPIIAVAPTPEHTEERLRLRKVKLSPADEYLLRGGNPRPIPMSLAALILSKTGKAEVKPKGVLVDRKDFGRHYFWHPDSRLCNDLSHRNRKVIYVYSPLQPELIHCLDEQGRYLETLPRLVPVDAFDQDATKKAHAAKARQISRVAAHLQRIKQPESDAALETISKNITEMQRVVQITKSPVSPETQPAPSPLGDRIHQAANATHHNYRDDLPITPAKRQTKLPTNNRITPPTSVDLLLAAAEANDEDYPY
jgi:hypothetical protein